MSAVGLPIIKNSTRSMGRDQSSNLNSEVEVTNKSSEINSTVNIANQSSELNSKVDGIKESPPAAPTQKEPINGNL